MRLLAALLAIFFSVIGLGFWTNNQLQQSADELMINIDLIYEEINLGQWESAMRYTEQLEQKWEQKIQWWPVFLDHQEIDYIDFAIAKNKEYVASQNTPLALGQLSEMRRMIKHIPEKGAINITNIF
jgi:hypothetical protein